VEVQVADATRWLLPPEPLVIYLFNPFGPRAHRAFARRVEERIERSSDPLWVVHSVPEAKGAWSEAPSLRVVEDEARRLILKSRRGEADVSSKAKRPAPDEDAMPRE